MLYLFNPLPEEGLLQVMANLDRSLREEPRPLYVLYHNPLLDHVLAQCSGLGKHSGSLQFCVYASRSVA